ncbi:MAG: protein kinase [Polyangiaceae bacterium]|nr:protein kinase [Polyangiaceae bacterium]
MSPPQRDYPDRLGRYEIVERLSAGGMGEVFVARMVGPGGFLKPVALKRIHPHLASDSEFIDMLHDEARLAAAVEHPNIVRTIDVGQDGDSHFVVLEFVSGDQVGKLQREMARRGQALPAWIVAWVGARIAAALHAVHEARGLDGQPLEIVHRDVSPGNIMFADAGQPMLFDFGVAKAKQRIHHTSSGELKGKLPYMAPETFLGAAVDRSVDVFGLGVVLYELATNVSPFKRPSDVDIITALQAATVPPLCAVRRDIEPGLSAIVMRAMARDRALRYPDGASLEADLAAYAREAGMPHDPTTAGRWLAHHFPERIEVRRALLARVASAAPLPSSPTSAPRPMASAPGGAYVEPSLMPTPTNNGVARASTDARLAVSSPGTGHPAVGARGRSLVAAGVVVATLGLGVAAAFAIGRGGSSEAADGATSDAAAGGATAAASAPAPTTQAPTAPAAQGSAEPSALPAPSASASHSAAPAVSAPVEVPTAARPVATPTVAVPVGPAPKKGPLVREY